MISEINFLFRRHFCPQCRIQASLHACELRTREPEFHPCPLCETIVSRIVAGEIVPESVL